MKHLALLVGLFTVACLVTLTSAEDWAGLEGGGLRHNASSVDVQPQAAIGRHVDHRQSSWDLFYRAGSRYQDMPDHADFVKPVLYHDILGPRLKVNYLEPLQQGLLKELTLEQSLNLFYAWFGHSPDTEPNLSKLAEGLSPDYVYDETKRAVDGVAGRAAVYSGIGLDIPKGGGWGKDVWQSDADEVYQAVRKAFDAGAAGIVASREYEEITTGSLAFVGRAVRDAVTGTGETKRP